jgi:hypothetical protein
VVGYGCCFYQETIVPVKRINGGKAGAWNVFCQKPEFL